MNQSAKKSWFGRNWKWFVPVGCLSFVLISFGFVVLILYFVFGMIKSSEVYQQAFLRARSNQEVLNSLGSPIKDGFFVSGSISVNGASGKADLAIPISGPKGKGTVFVEARKSAGLWSFGKLVVRIDEKNNQIDLMDENK